MGLLIDLSYEGRVIEDVYVNVRYANGAKGGGLYRVDIHPGGKGTRPIFPHPDVAVLEIPFAQPGDSQDLWLRVGAVYDVNRAAFEQAYEDFKAKVASGLLPWAQNVRDA